MAHKKILIVCVQETRKRYRFIYEPLLLTEHEVRLFFDKGGFFGFLVRAIAFAIKNTDIDVTVIFGGDLKNLIWFAISKLFFRSKIVMRLGGDPVSVRLSKIEAHKLDKNYRGLIKLWINFRITSWLIRHIKDYILVNANILVALRQINKNEINYAIIPQYVETYNRSPKNEDSTKITILTVSNFNYSEKSSNLINILNYLDKNFNKRQKAINITIVGGGPYLSKLNKNVSEINAGSGDLTVTIAGYANDVHHYLDKADIFLYCSTLDSTPNVLLEAKAHGLPVIINRFIPFLELFKDGENCYFFDLNNENQFISKLERLIESETIRYEMGKSNLQDIKKNYSKGLIAAKIQDFLSTVH